MPSRSIHIVTNVGISFFVWLNNIRLCIYIPRFLFHSSIDGHSVSFYVLAIVNNAAMNMRVQVSFQVSVFFPFDKYPTMEMLDPLDPFTMVVLLLIF